MITESAGQGYRGVTHSYREGATQITRRDSLQFPPDVAPTSLPSRHRPAPPAYDAVPPLAAINASRDRLVKVTVCLRPFRPQGPRIEAERIGDKLVVHNYGHGGSGWSLSWGSASLAIERAFASTGAGPAGQQIAVLGSGALGLTTATLLQRAGARVTLYAKDQPTQSRSFHATGSWTPDSRIALTPAMPDAFPALWERMVRTSWSTYAGLLGLPGNPIEFADRYILSDLPPEQAHQAYLDADRIGFARLNDRVPELLPPHLDLPPGTHPFPTRYARRNSQLMFNVTTLVHTLTEDLLTAGARFETRELHTPAELATLPQTTLFNCTGYGARALFADDSLIPVRGQIGWLAAQPEVNYGMVLGDLNILGRRDGIVVQLSEQSEATGWQDSNEQPDPREADEGLRRLRQLLHGMRPTGSV